MFSANNGSVTVDKQFARFGSKSYAINKINSVEVRRTNVTPKTGLTICSIFIGLWIIAALMNEDTTAKIVCAAIAALFVAGAIYFSRRPAVHEFELYLVTSAGQIQAFVTRDKEQMRELRDAIEAAMATH